MKRILCFSLFLLILLSSCTPALAPDEKEPKSEQTATEEVETPAETETAEQVAVIPVGETGTIDLRVVSFNVNTYSHYEDYRYWHTRKDALCAYILSLNADVLCLQETPTIYRDYFAEKFAEQYGWEYFNHNMTLYRKDRFEMLEFVPRYFGTDPTKKAPAYDASMERNFTVTHLREMASGAEFYAVDTHFDHKGLKARFMAAEQVVETMSQSEIPYFILGDFNTTEESYAYKTLTKLFLDASKVAPDTDSGRSYNKWGEHPTEGLPIDFCFVCPVNITVHSYKILRHDRWGDGYLYSDHFPVKVELTLAY